MNNPKKKIYYTKPSISSLEIKYATDAATNGWGENCYDYIYRFEDFFKDHLDTKYAIATSSCTGALHMGMSALNIGPGDEVIMADTNWIATASPIVQLGARPVFVDILKDSWCLDPNKVETAINSRTKAIIAVHLYGNLCDMDSLLEISRKYNIPIIEDSAEAIGSIYKGSRAGSMGLFGAFSFHGSKTITTGEGGMFVTNNSELYEKVLTLSNHGRSREQQKQFWADNIGFKYKLSNIQASIGCAQMERIEQLIDRKRKILRIYKKHLDVIDGISMNPEPNGTVNGSWMPTIVFDEHLGITREKIKYALNKENIDARVFFWPLSSLPMFGSIKENINSISICERAINLPSYFDIEDEQIERICEIVKLQISCNLKK
jgi:perosamine synthetase